MFLEQNPWWSYGDVPGLLARSVARPFAEALFKRLSEEKVRRFQLILGPRRVGKTTCMYQTVKSLLQAGVRPTHIKWIRLDHPMLMGISLGNIVGNLMKAEASEQPTYLFLDEITYADNWDKWLKTFYDDNWPVHLVGTSSSTAALKTGRAESGVGRWEEQYLPPYMFSEYLDLLGVSIELSDPAQTLAETLSQINPNSPEWANLARYRQHYLFTGGFPELLLATSMEVNQQDAILHSQQILRSDAVERAIYKDIPQVFRIENPRLLERLLYTLAGSITGILSPTTVKTQLEMSQPTLDRYLHYLEQSYLILTLQNYSNREGAKQARGRKVYFVDGAVRNAALQRGVLPLSNPEEMGSLLENLVAGQLYGLSRQTDSRLYYWRDGNSEVDFVYDHPTQPLAFLIGSSMTHHRSGLAAIQRRYPRLVNRCYMVSPDASFVRPEENGGIGSVPLDF